MSCFLLSYTASHSVTFLNTSCCFIIHFIHSCSLYVDPFVHNAPFHSLDRQIRTYPSRFNVNIYLLHKLILTLLIFKAEMIDYSIVLTQNKEVLIIIFCFLYPRNLISLSEKTFLITIHPQGPLEQLGQSLSLVAQTVKHLPAIQDTQV